MAAPPLSAEQEELASRAEERMSRADDLADAAQRARNAYGFAKRILRMGTQDLTSAETWAQRGDRAMQEIRASIREMDSGDAD